MISLTWKDIFLRKKTLKNRIEDIEKAKYYLNLLEKDLKGVQTDERQHV